MSEIVVYGQFDQIKQAAIALQMSGYFSDVRTKEQAITKVLAGAELGLRPFANMAGINIMQGKPVLGEKVIVTLVKNDQRYDYRIKRADDKACILVWFESGKEVGEAGFTIEEAQSAGLASKDNWRKYPSDMLFARAISRGARRYAPGIFGGAPVYTPDEMGVDTDEDGYIESTVQDVTPTPEAVKIDGKPIDISHSSKPPNPPNVIQPELDGSNGKMALETALAVQNSEGITYGELDDETLGHMANAMRDVLAGKKKTSKYTPEDLKFKVDAIDVILAHRSAG